MDHQFQVKSLTLNFGPNKILSSGSVDFKTGDIVGIFGRNGSGKTSLFKILFGTLKANDIELYLDGRLWDAKKNLNTIFGYHSQEMMLPKGLTVNYLISIYILDVERRQKIYYSTGIHDMLNKKVRDLSLGQQRYLQFLLVLNLDQPFLLLDEPFSMVEPLFRDLIKEKILEYSQYKGFLIADHYYLDVIEIANKINLIKNGTIIPIENAEELITLEYLGEQALLK